MYFHRRPRASISNPICPRMGKLSGSAVFLFPELRSGSSVALRREKRFLLFKHADCREDSRKTYTLFEWATQAFRVNSWFPPENYQGKKYSRVGNSSFIAEGGSNYWASRHYACWEQSYYLQQKDTYKLLQRQFGARPALLKMGHFDATDHHDLFEIKTDALVDSDIMSSQILRGGKCQQL